MWPTPQYAKYRGVINLLSEVHKWLDGMGLDEDLDARIREAIKEHP